MGPTASNSQPARYIFVKTPQAKRRLEPFVDEGNKVKTMSAPVCAIIGYDLAFYENLPRFFPHRPKARNAFIGKEERARTVAFRNGSLQGAYLILAARALGLDTGPMSGFDNAGVDQEFFPNGQIKSNFLCALGYGDASVLLPRLPERGHSEALFPMVAALMREAGLAFTDLDRIAVTRGPGSFTGVRAGIAAARGFALGCGAAIVTATSLEAMARGCAGLLAGAERRGGFLIAHDARRGELYVQLFDAAGRAVSEAALASPQEAALLARDAGLAAGSGAPLLAAEAERLGFTVSARFPDLLPEAVHLAELALERQPDGEPVSPLYLRAPDAKPQTDKALARA
jgi:3-hydroxypropanoate dehydrogenase